MIAIIFLIIGLSMIGWVMTGYAPSRVLKIQIARYFFIGIGEKILWVIDGDRVPWFLSYFPIPIGFKHIWVPLKWTELVAKGRMNEEVNDAGNPKKKKFSEPKEFADLPDSFIGERDQLVPFIKKFEAVDYEFPVESKDGFSFVIILTFIFHVFEPLKSVRIADFKMIGKLEVGNQLDPWAFKRTLDQIRSTNIDLIKDPNCGIIMPGGLDLKTYLDENKFPAYGFEIHEAGLQILDGKNVMDHLKLREVSTNTIQETLNLDEFGKKRVIERQIELADSNQENLLAKNAITTTYESLKPVIDDIWDGKAKVQGARKEVLFEINHEADNTGTEVLKFIEKNVLNSTQQNASKKQKMEAVTQDREDS